MTTRPMVSVVVPALNEASDIVGCLEAIAAQDYPMGDLEVIVVDGCSDDATAEVARRTLGQWGFASTAVLRNERRLTPSNLNVGLSRATGSIVCRVDARTRIEPHYVRTCVEILTSRPEVAVVGGAQIAIARNAAGVASGIARALNNRWSMGGSPYRRARVSGASDTVYLGAFRKDDLTDVGGWDDALPSNQDFDLNRRMADRGEVWFEASLRSGYLPRESLGALWRQYRRFGAAKADYWRHSGRPPEQRQWMLLIFPPAALVAGGGALVLSPQPARTGLALLAAAAAGATAIEVWGADEPVGGCTSHAAGVVAMGVVASGWWCGVVWRAVRASQRRNEQR